MRPFFFAMIEVHLYGKLRRFSENSDPKSQSVALAGWQFGDTVGRVIERLGIPLQELGTNIFLNGRYANLETRIQDGDRLGLFPDDMQLLYKWYFAPSQSSGDPKRGTGAPKPITGDPKNSKEPEK